MQLMNNRKNKILVSKCSERTFFQEADSLWIYLYCNKRYISLKTTRFRYQNVQKGLFFKKTPVYENTNNVTSVMYHRKNKILVSKCSERKNKILVSKCSERNVLTNNAQISKSLNILLFLVSKCSEMTFFSRSLLFMKIPTM